MLSGASVAVVSPEAPKLCSPYVNVRQLAYVIVLHAVYFGNNWMKKILRTAKIGRGLGRILSGCQRNFLNPIIPKTGQHVVILLINY